MTGHVELRRAADRAVTGTPGIRTLHSFSFGEHYDPENTGHALLVTHNEDRVSAGAGYPTHPHRDLEIVTWVLSGALRHDDAAGPGGLVEEGSVQRVSAGRGIRHAEWNDAATGPAVRFLQMWVLPDRAGGEPSYAHAPAPQGGWVTLASGLPEHRYDAAVSIGSAAALHLARLPADGACTLPDAPYLHVFVARGRVDVEGAGILGTGDAARLTAVGAARLSGVDDADVLTWEMRRDRRPT